MFSGLSHEELERRRLASIEALKRRRDEEFERWYQKRCDEFFWRNGRCCAGCDHWNSEQGDVGECLSAPPVSGEQVLKSLGITWCSYIPPPGQPYTRRDHVCGAFQDTFDWASLGKEYLDAIGARHHLENSDAQG
jgi:hypothetical protein